MTHRTPAARHLFTSSVVLFSCLLTIAPALARATNPPTPSGNLAALTQQIDAQIQQPRFAAASWGIDIVSLDSGRTVYSHRPARLLQPASTAKLFTTALGLATLGSNYRLPTRVLSAGNLRHGRLDGSLILYGSGDPTLGTDSSENWAAQLAGQLAASGIKSVHGDVIGDDSYFTGSPLGTGWEADDLQSWFAVPASALSVQENIIHLTVSPATRAGFPASVVGDAGDANPSIAGQIITAPKTRHGDINLYRAPGSTTVYAFGSVPVNAPERRFKLSVPDPALRATRQLRRALAQNNIHVSGTVRVVHWPADDTELLSGTRLLAEVRSPPLMTILERGLKRSQNLYLQDVLLNVGAHAQASAVTLPSSFRSTEGWAMHAMHTLLTDIGIAPASVLLGEGTGLSRRDLVSPEAMVRLLAWLSRQPWGARLQLALPIAGIDGTLASHMRGTPAADNVHAKTGSLTYVHCLAGYVTTTAGEHLAFAIMLNNYHRAPGAARTSSEVDVIAEMLAAFRGHS